MPVFIFLVFVLAAVLWVLLSFVFRPLGRFVGRVWKDAKDAMDEEDPSEDDTAVSYTHLTLPTICSV